MTKSIVTGGVMLVALAALVMGLTGVLELSSAGIVSWAAVGAVATILFGAFGGFKPFFSSGMPDDDEGGGGGGGGNGGSDNGGGSPLEALEGQSQSIARKLVTVGGEDEDGRPLFDDRAPIVSQPTVASPPIFNPDAPTGTAPAQANQPLFGQALREQLDNDRVSGEDHIDHGPEALETGQIETAPEAASPPPLVSETAPWVAARNAQIDEDASAVPTIDVEESPSWVTTADADVLDAEQQDPEAADDEEDWELAGAETDHDGVEAEYDADQEGAEAEHDAEELEAEAEEQEDETIADEAIAETDRTEVDGSETEVTDEFDASDSTPDDDTDDGSESDTAIIDETHDDVSVEAKAESDGDPLTFEPASEDIGSEEDAGESSGDDLVVTTSQSDQLPVVMKSPSALEIQKYSPTEILAVVRAQESELVDTLIGEGVLTTSGPITDKDVRTMLFVAVSSNELIEVLTEASGDSPELRTSGRPALRKG